MLAYCCHTVAFVGTYLWECSAFWYSSNLYCVLPSWCKDAAVQPTVSFVLLKLLCGTAANSRIPLTCIGYSRVDARTLQWPHSALPTVAFVFLELLCGTAPNSGIPLTCTGYSRVATRTFLWPHAPLPTVAFVFLEVLSWTAGTAEFKQWRCCGHMVAARFHPPKRHCPRRTSK